MHVDRRVGAAKADRHDVIDHPAAAWPGGLAGRRAGVVLAKNPHLAAIARVGGDGERQGEDQASEGGVTHYLPLEIIRPDSWGRKSIAVRQCGQMVARGSIRE